MSKSNRFIRREIHEMVGGADEEGDDDQTYQLGHHLLSQGYNTLVRRVRIRDLDHFLSQKVMAELDMGSVLRDVIGDLLYRVQWKQKRDDKPILVSVARSVADMYANLDG